MAHFKAVSVAAVFLMFACLFFVLPVNAQDSYRVSYFTNFPTVAGGGSVPVDSNLYVSGSTVVVLPNVGGLYCEGYVFVGWEVYGEPNPPTYAVDGNVVTPPAFMIYSDVDLYGVWVKESGVVPPVDVFVGSEFGLFLVFVGLAVLVFVLAVVRQTVGLYGLSAGLWFVVAFAVNLVPGVAGGALGVVLMIVCVLFGVIMGVFCVAEMVGMARSGSGGGF